MTSACSTTRPWIGACAVALALACGPGDSGTDDAGTGDSGTDSGQASGSDGGSTGDPGTATGNGSSTDDVTTATGDGSGDVACPLPPMLCPGAMELVDVDGLADRLADPDLQIVDLRAAADHGAARIPGAIHVDPTTIRATIDGVPGQVAPLDDVAAVLSAAGLRRDADVVAYGASEGLDAARLLWTLQYYGHPGALALLDGGWPAWDAAGPAIDDSPFSPTPTTYGIDAAVDAVHVDAQWVLDRLDDPDVIIVDARTPSEWEAGRIPGAVNVDWTTNLMDGLFLPMDEVRALYPDGPDATFVAYCGSGTRASVTYFTLRWLGLSDVRLYDGSWNEWGADPALPKDSG